MKTLRVTKTTKSMLGIPKTYMAALSVHAAIVIALIVAYFAGVDEAELVCFWWLIACIVGNAARARWSHVRRGAQHSLDNNATYVQRKPHKRSNNPTRARDFTGSRSTPAAGSSWACRKWRTSLLPRPAPPPRRWTTRCTTRATLRCRSSLARWPACPSSAKTHTPRARINSITLASFSRLTLLSFSAPGGVAPQHYTGSSNWAGSPGARSEEPMRRGGRHSLHRRGPRCGRCPWVVRFDGWPRHFHG